MHPLWGLLNRSKRYAMIVKNGTLTTLNIDENPGECTLSSGDEILKELS